MIPARFAPPPPPTTWRSGVRMPKARVHSAPEYVVGTETTGRPVWDDAFLAVSIAEPPPIARSESALAGTSIWGAGTADQRPTDGTSSDQRELATRNGRSTPSSRSTPGRSSSVDWTIKASLRVSLFRCLMNGLENFVVGRPEDRHHDFAKANDAVPPDHDDPAPRAEDAFHLVIACCLALRVREQAYRQAVVRRELAVLFHGVGVDANDFGAGLLIP